MPTQFFRPAPADSFTLAGTAGLNALLHPQPVYALGLRQIVNGPAPGDNLFVGWRYLLNLGDNFGAATDVDQPVGGTPVYAGVSYGPTIAKAVSAAQLIETVPGIPGAAYEVRFLTIPGVLTDALWLRATAPAADWIVPYDTPVKALQEMSPYSMTSFLQILLPFARARGSLVLK